MSESGPNIGRTSTRRGRSPLRPAAPNLCVNGRRIYGFIVAMDEVNEVSHVFGIGKKAISIGRGTKCDIRINNRKFSRNHASLAIKEEGDGALVVSLKNESSFPNATRVLPYLLPQGNSVVVDSPSMFLLHNLRFKWTLNDGDNQKWGKLCSRPVIYIFEEPELELACRNGTNDVEEESKAALPHVESINRLIEEVDLTENDDLQQASHFSDQPSLNGADVMERQESLVMSPEKINNSSEPEEVKSCSSPEKMDFETTLSVLFNEKSLNHGNGEKENKSKPVVSPEKIIISSSEPREVNSSPFDTTLSVLFNEKSSLNEKSTVMSSDEGEASISCMEIKTHASSQVSTTNDKSFLRRSSGEKHQKSVEFSPEKTNSSIAKRNRSSVKTKSDDAPQDPTINRKSSLKRCSIVKLQKSVTFSPEKINTSISKRSRSSVKIKNDDSFQDATVNEKSSLNESKIVKHQKPVLLSPEKVNSSSEPGEVNSSPFDTTLSVLFNEKSSLNLSNVAKDEKSVVMSPEKFSSSIVERTRSSMKIKSDSSLQDPTPKKSLRNRSSVVKLQKSVSPQKINNSSEPGEVSSSPFDTTLSQLFAEKSLLNHSNVAKDDKSVMISPEKFAKSIVECTRSSMKIKSDAPPQDPSPNKKSSRKRSNVVKHQELPPQKTIAPIAKRTRSNQIKNDQGSSKVPEILEENLNKVSKRRPRKITKKLDGVTETATARQHAYNLRQRTPKAK